MYNMCFTGCGCHHCRLNTPVKSYELDLPQFSKVRFVKFENPPYYLTESTEPDAGDTPSPPPSSKVESPASSTPSTVPGTDEEARRMASEKYQQHLAENISAAGKALTVTPESHVRQNPSPLPKLTRLQSCSLFGDQGQSPSSTTAATPSPQNVTSKATNIKKSKLKKKAKSKGKTAKRFAACKSRPKKATLPPVPPPALVPTVEPPADPAAPPPTPPVKTEPAANHPLGQATLSLLNRGSTTDMMDLDTLQDMVTRSVRAAVDTRSEAGSSTITKSSKGGKRRTRNKETHNRRMRFYRSLSSS